MFLKNVIPTAQILLTFLSVTQILLPLYKCVVTVTTSLFLFSYEL